jgi:hypothetical protein
MKVDEIVFVKGNKLYLDTSMTQSAFSKSRLSERMSEQGFLAEKKNDSWEFSPWTFTGTMLRTSDDDNISEASRALAETVLLEGNAFSGSTLKSLFDTDDSSLSEQGKATSSEAAAAVCSAIERAVETNVKLTDNGAGGIFISSSFDKIIFLPEDLFETAVTCRGDEIYSAYDGLYIYRTLAGSAALRFTQSVIAYRALTGKFPFASLNSVKRHEDYLDHNFIHLSNMVYGLDEKLSFFVDNALMRNPKIEVHAKASVTDKRSFNEKITTSIKSDVIKERNEHEEKTLLRAGMQFPLSTFYRELGLAEDGTLPADGKLKAVERNAPITQEQFDADVKKEAHAFNKSLTVKRWFRHYRTVLTGTGIAILVVSFFMATYHHDNMRNPTTKSLTSTEAVQMFYSAMNNLDVVSTQGCTKGSSMNKLVDVISNFYVTSKQRSAYSAKNNCVTPASWLCFNNDGNYTIFGLTQFTIDGTTKGLNFEGPIKNTHPKTLAHEDGVNLVSNVQTNHLVHYYLVYTEGLDQLHVDEHTDTVTLTWKKDRWVLTNVDQTDNDVIVDFKQFSADYKTAYEDTMKDIYKTAAKLSTTYTWLSSTDDIREAKKKFDKENSIF